MRPAPLPLLLIGLAVIAALALTPWIVQAQSRDSGSDFTLAAAKGYPTGIWSDGTTMWASDFTDAKLYAYRMSDRSRDSGEDFALDADDESYEGIWSAGSTMWVASRDDAKLYAYDWNNPATGGPTITRRGPSGRDANGGRPLHRRRGRAGRRHLRISMGFERRERRHGHRGRDRFDLHHRPRRPGQDDQGQGVLHRRRRQRRVVDQRADGSGRGPGHLRPDAFGDGGHRRRDERRDEAQDLDRLPAPRPRRHARAVPSGERTVGPAGRGFRGPARAARPGPEPELPRDGPGVAPSATTSPVSLRSASRADRLLFLQLRLFDCTGQGPALRTTAASRAAAGPSLPRRSRPAPSPAHAGSVQALGDESLLVVLLTVLSVSQVWFRQPSLPANSPTSWRATSQASAKASPARSRRRRTGAHRGAESTSIGVAHLDRRRQQSLMAIRLLLSPPP